MRGEGERRSVEVKEKIGRKEESPMDPGMGTQLYKYSSFGPLNLLLTYPVNKDHLKIPTTTEL